MYGQDGDDHLGIIECWTCQAQFLPHSTECMLQLFLHVVVGESKLGALISGVGRFQQEDI